MNEQDYFEIEFKIFKFKIFDNYIYITTPNTFIDLIEEYLKDVENNKVDLNKILLNCPISRRTQLASILYTIEPQIKEVVLINRRDSKILDILK